MREFPDWSPTIRWVFLALGPWLALGPTALVAGEIAPEHRQFFEAKVRPLLIQRCLNCHGPEHQKGGLRLDSLTAMSAGGESGPAVVPGNVDDSLLLSAVRYETFEMPPAKQLPEDEIAILEKWIQLGAPWPGDHDVPLRVTAGDKLSDEDRQWWAIQPLADPAAPTPKNEAWSRNEIDRFVLAKLEEQGLSPAPEADRLSLMRRLSFDLTGLPPTPEEARQFLSDTSSDAYEKLVERLLASERYGERWARHWLDLVRYADSDGYRADEYRPDAWRYRDYVIQSFNADKPYDRFLQEQLAGDELFPGDPEALTATGYLRQWIYEYNQRDVRTQWDIILTDVTDTTADVFLGVGMQCARCHDHKYDPILQDDYFRLRAFFEPMLPRDDLVAASDAEQSSYREQLAAWEQATAKIRDELAALEAKHREAARRSAIEKFPDDIQQMILTSPHERAPFATLLAELAGRQIGFEYARLDTRIKGDDKEKRLALLKELSAFDAQKPAPLPTPMAVTDVGREAPPTHLPKNAEHVLAPGVLTILDPSEAPVEPPEGLNSTGRRAWLAKWMSQPENPLTTRVIVNRVWQYHFGKGLAANSSDFGRLGESPTHPALLDWLARRFVRDGWSFKQLHRLIVTSATYRQSSEHPQLAESMLVDPLNRFLWHASVRRLDAEEIRDAMLVMSGQLNVEAGGPGVNPDVPRRSIYTRVMRNARDPLLDAFDLPQFFRSEAIRQTTTTPVQSLLLINNAQILQIADRMAGSVLSKAASNAGDNPSAELAAAVIEAWWRVHGRAPLPQELDRSLAYLTSQMENHDQEDEAAAKADLVIGKLPYRDGQAILVDPRPEAPSFAVAHQDMMNVDNFTVEVFFQPRSVYETGTVRTLVSKWDGNSKSPGWSLGITGKGSRRKPQTVVLLMHGTLASGSIGEAAVFSDQHVALNKPYYLGASFQAATNDRPGTVTFYLKDLSNDDEPLQVATVEHALVGGLSNNADLAIGSLATSRSSRFDGLIDDVRVSPQALSREELLFSAEGLRESTIGYWQFEVDPGLYFDTSNHQLHARSAVTRRETVDLARMGLADLCHALLNSSEFLYVR